MLDRPERGERAVGFFGLAELGEADRLERVEDRALAGGRAAARDRGQRPIVEARMHEGVDQLAPDRRSPRRGGQRPLEARREGLAVAEQPAQPRRRGMALRSSPDCGPSCASSPAIASSIRPSASMARRPSRAGPTHRRARARRARSNRSSAGRPASRLARARLWAMSGSAGASAAALASAATASARSSSRRWARPSTCHMRASSGLASAPARASGSASAAQPVRDRRRRRPEDLVGVRGDRRSRELAPARSASLTVPPSASAGSVAAITAATAARSAAERSGCQVSTIRMTRKRVARVQRLMLDRVVEDPGLARLATAGSRRRRGTSSRRARSAANGRPGGYWRRRCAAGYARPARAARTSHWARAAGCPAGRAPASSAITAGQWRALASIGDAVLDEVDRGPGLVAVERRPLPERHVVRILDIGDELGPLRRHHPMEILGDRRRRRLERLQPGEQRRGRETRAR